ncbi:HAD-IA family hydrolase [Streptomyces syringium]|uniref:HAD-IA family hydrolase n=1 Tax=Streptomyces syringium TaxID=76729 RepID=UPI003430248D
MGTPIPAPDLYLTACEALGVASKRSLAFEDSATGIASARAAGLYVAVVPFLPGIDLDHDWLGASLAEPELLGWAKGLG